MLIYIVFSWLRCLQISEGKLRAIVELCGPVELVMGGPPCEDLALVNADRTGVMGKKSGLLHYSTYIYSCTFFDPPSKN